jgi:hypothetical protein
MGSSWGVLANDSSMLSSEDVETEGRSEVRQALGFVFR